jgi:hypothetical protein
MGSMLNMKILIVGDSLETAGFWLVLGMWDKQRQNNMLSRLG